MKGVGANVIPFVVTLGDLEGIGPDIVIDAYARHRAHLPPFFVIGPAQDLGARIEQLKSDIRLALIDQPAQAQQIFSSALPLLPLSAPQEVADRNAFLVRESIKISVGFSMSGEAAGLVTGPAQKWMFQSEAASFPGHTEFLAHLTGVETSVMMLASEKAGLRVLPLTIHLPLRDVAQALAQVDIVGKVRIAVEALQSRFSIPKPRVVFCGLNPHAGESGQFGDEEARLIEPAIEELRKSGIECSGPVAADSLFHQDRRTTYDLAVCMYHDQALIPLKTLDFYGGVNVTLGLPIIRVSPDHGTARPLAGTGKADCSSFIAALQMANQMADRMARNGRAS